jgi:hypothetical protein
MRTSPVQYVRGKVWNRLLAPSGGVRRRPWKGSHQRHSGLPARPHVRLSTATRLTVMQVTIQRTRCIAIRPYSPTSPLRPPDATATTMLSL